MNYTGLQSQLMGHQLLRLTFKVFFPSLFAYFRGLLSANHFSTNFHILRDQKLSPYYVNTDCLLFSNPQTHYQFNWVNITLHSDFRISAIVFICHLLLITNAAQPDSWSIVVRGLNHWKLQNDINRRT